METTVVIILTYMVFIIKESLASTIDTHTGSDFCYHLNDQCGPTSQAWDPLCHTGVHQSPINLPPSLSPSSSVTLNSKIYKGSSFRIQNNGHSVQFDFNNEPASKQAVKFPDPLTFQNPNSSFVYREYIFSGGHFHWGVNDHVTGSEHCIGDNCTAMELHLVHYLAKYKNATEAVTSGDENALSVIGVLINVSPAPNPDLNSLDPIVRNLKHVEFAVNDTTVWTRINESLNLDELLREALDEVYIYKGSLTTPGCNEQVNWYVLKKHAQASHKELETFRTVVKDEKGETLNKNHRPLQPDRGRKIILSKVVSSSNNIHHGALLYLIVICHVIHVWGIHI